MKRNLIWLIIWGIGFALIEAAVVVYLRKIYYPTGFQFPVAPVDWDIAGVEIAREAATLIVMWAVAELSQVRFQQKLAVFMVLFGIWDFFYYLFLKIISGWPESLATLDVVFLIPRPWVGPIWAPVLISLGLVYAGVSVLRDAEKGVAIRYDKKFWFLEIAAGVVIIASFLQAGAHLISETTPDPFPWYLFLAGFGVGFGTFLHARRKYRRNTTKG